MTTVNVQEAKTHLSDLLKRVEAGEEIVIARAGKPIVALTAVTTPTLTLGLFADLGPAPDDAFEPLSDAELAGWEDGGQHDPLNW